MSKKKILVIEDVPQGTPDLYSAFKAIQAVDPTGSILIPTMIRIDEVALIETPDYITTSIEIKPKLGKPKKNWERKPY